MLPESCSIGRIELYRAVEFPSQWELSGSLLDDVSLVDATIFRHEGKFWMFAGGSKSELFLYYADSPLGPWFPHPKNPVVVDVARARPAGQVFSHGSVLIRPGQDCARSYGEAIVLNRIEVLSPTDYSETPIKVLTSNWFPGSGGTHTLNHSERYQTLDARILVPEPQLIVGKLLSWLGNHFPKNKA
jgi:hypothetical protein